MFLADPLAVPTEVVAYVAEQLDIADPACVKSYVDREKTKLEHAWEIQREYGLASFGEVEAELSAWIADQSWMTGDGPKAIFDGAVAWLRERQALLPGITTLERLVGEGRRTADRRLWAQLTRRLSGSQKAALRSLLSPPADGRGRVTELERLRKGVFRPTSKGMVAAVGRLSDLIRIGVDLDVPEVPPRRLVGLATYGLSSKAPQLRRLEPPEYRLAVLVATVKVLIARATDDVLELFDLLMVTDLYSKAERESRDEKLRRYPRVSRHAGKLAAAVKVLLEMTEVSPELSVEMIWDHIENAVTKGELYRAVAVIDELVPVDDAELNGQRLEELAGRLATVRAFLPSMMRVVEFGATAEGAAVLAATKTLGELLTTKTKLPATWLDARRVDHDLIGGAWKRLVYRDPRPPETVDRAAYTLCLLEQFHRHLKHRNIFAPRSSRWRDPRAGLLSGPAWERTREVGMNALNLPSDPAALLADHAAAVDAAYRQVAARLDGDGPASVDEDGKLHLAALEAIPDPPSLVDLRRRVERMLPEVDLPEMVLEVMSWVPGVHRGVRPCLRQRRPRRRPRTVGGCGAVRACDERGVQTGDQPWRGRADPGPAPSRRSALCAARDDEHRQRRVDRGPGAGAAGADVGRRAARVGRRHPVRGPGPHDPRTAEPTVLRTTTRHHLAEHAQRPSRRAGGEGGARNTA